MVAGPRNQRFHTLAVDCGPPAREDKGALRGGAFSEAPLSAFCGQYRPQGRLNYLAVCLTLRIRHHRPSVHVHGRLDRGLPRQLSLHGDRCSCRIQPGAVRVAECVPASGRSDTSFHRSGFEVVCADAFLPVRFETGWVREQPSIRGGRTLVLPVFQDCAEIGIEWKVVV